MNDSIRALFPVTERAIYLNHAAVSAPPTPTIAAIKSQLADVSENGSVNFRKWLAVRESARQLIAGMLGSLPNQVAFMRNTSDALSTVANGLDWQTGDNLVTFRHEFPSNLYPWLRLRDALGLEVRVCEERDGRVDVDELIRLIDARTRIVAIS
jgi:selenocysteine lyase/cysteine desulfurase